ncbi:cellulose binding domain-containing protein [Micromonospora eburnea]|uniref:Cellulose binding domain-containing protein n=1 Tax=Micromonospora eburnea TaxID=227316 RepID=A0A1C6UH09_9ACTN|nr:cellulose binding domain-containing protein [Micromonospora eburnea]SCL53385.1 Cellulose binding domain-containing protein [Micromonospora eburnea]
MHSRPTRPGRWLARTLTLPLLFATLVASGTTAYAAEGAEAASTCTARYRREGVEVWVSFRNIAPTTVNGWTLSWALADSQQIWTIWNAALVSHTGGIATVRDLGWNANLAPGVEMTIGYIAGGNAPPSGFALNGDPCQAG